LPKLARQLTDKEVRSIGVPGLHSVGGQAGLRIQISKNGAKSWILRVMINGKVREIGLGPFSKVSLKAARLKARALHEIIQQGRDPIVEKRKAASDLKHVKARTKNFDEVAELYIASIEKQWRNPKSRAQWESSLEAYASPYIGDRSCAAIDTNDMLTILDPIWRDKTETATRVRSRIEKILSYATTRGFRSGENPAQYKGHLDSLLPPPQKLKNVRHQPALDYEELPAFMRALRKLNSIAARCLEFSILTASRQGEVRGMEWDEIDFNKEQWTIPSSRMKACKEHVVPLSPRCRAILDNLPQRADSCFVFAAVRGGQLSDATVGKVVRSINETSRSLGLSGFVDRHQDNRDIVPHGFRSTFRDWAAESTSYPREVIEHCLAHQLKDKSEAAYQRKTSLPKRTKLMTLYGQYCSHVVNSDETVIRPIRKTKTKKNS
jgi:integrase